MKKLLAIVLAAVMVMSLCATAFAATDTGSVDRHPFNRNAVSMTAITSLHTGLSHVKSASYAGHIYIRHYIYNNDGDPALTNLFCAFKNSTSGTPIGNKWMPTNGGYFINNGNLTAGSRYAAGCRANTDHALAEHGSHSRVQISGYLHPNAKP